MSKIGLGVMMGAVIAAVFLREMLLLAGHPVAPLWFTVLAAMSLAGFLWFVTAPREKN